MDASSCPYAGILVRKVCKKLLVIEPLLRRVIGWPPEAPSAAI